MILSTYKLGVLQAKANRLFRSYMSKLFKEYNLSIPEWNILGTVSETKGMRLADIAELLDVEAPLVTNLIDMLEKKGLVQRKGHSEDKRAKVITLTQQGSDLVPVIEEKAQKIVHTLFKDIPEQNQETYCEVLKHMAATLS